MPLKRHRTPSPESDPAESTQQRRRSSPAHLEYERLMAEAKQAFDQLTTQNAAARLNSAARRKSPKPI